MENDERIGRLDEMLKRVVMFHYPPPKREFPRYLLGEESNLRHPLADRSRDSLVDLGYPEWMIDKITAEQGNQ